MKATAASSTSVPSTLAALKSATAGAHAAVERHVDLEKASSSVSAYRRLLAAFYGFYGPLENELRIADWSSLRLEPIWRAPRLRRDLVALEVVDPEALPRCEQLPPVQSVSQLAGTLYVIEGAALGGQIIARTIRERLSIGPENGGSFFAGDADQTGKRWKAFREVAERAPIDREHTINAAQRTFSTFDSWLRQWNSRHELSKESQ